MRNILKPYENELEFLNSIVYWIVSRKQEVNMFKYKCIYQVSISCINHDIVM